MHEWFAQPIAAGRIAAARQRATAHRLRVVEGRDLTSRLTGSLSTAADHGEARLRRRRTAAAAAVAPA